MSPCWQMSQALLAIQTMLCYSGAVPTSCDAELLISHYNSLEKSARKGMRGTYQQLQGRPVVPGGEGFF